MYKRCMRKVVLEMIDKSEKLLKSIDNMLSDILKELKRQASLKETTLIAITSEDVKGGKPFISCL